MYLFVFFFLFSVQSAAQFFFINAPSHTMSWNSLMSMAVIYSAVCDNGSLINAIQKPVYVKITTMQTIGLCKCYGIHKFRQLFAVSNFKQSNDIKCTELLVPCIPTPPKLMHNIHTMPQV